MTTQTFFARYETRIKSTRIALVIVGALAIWMLGATYA